MSYEFKKLSEVAALTEVPDGAKVLAEANGQIVRVPGSGLGGSTGGACLFRINATAEDDGSITSDKTYEEIKDAINSGCLPYVELYTNGETYFCYLLGGETPNFVNNYVNTISFSYINGAIDQILAVTLNYEFNGRINYNLTSFGGNGGGVP